MVLETQYPTSYGCYRGKVWRDFELYRASKRTTHGPYSSRKKAVDAAEAMVIDDAIFESDDVDELRDQWRSEEVWNSADLENCDNDEETLIEVYEESILENKLARDEAEMRQSFEDFCARADSKDAQQGQAIALSGKVHYSFPPREQDIHAELEIDLGAVPADATAASLVSDHQARHVKTLCIKDKTASAGTDLLPDILGRFQNLRELHWHNAMLHDADRLTRILAGCPRLPLRLTTLSVPLGSIAPDAVQVLQEVRWPKLTTLDLYGSLEIGLCSSSWDMYDEGGGDNDYDEPMLDAVQAMPKLRDLYIGDPGGRDGRRGFLTYVLSRRAYDNLECFARVHYGQPFGLEDEEGDY